MGHGHDGVAVPGAGRRSPLFRKDIAAARSRRRASGGRSSSAPIRWAGIPPLASLPGTSFRGFFDDRATERWAWAARRLLGPIDHVARFLKEQRIDVVYIALPIGSQSRTADLLAGLKDTTASVCFVPDASLFAPMRPKVEMLASTPVVRVCETPFLGMKGVVKRAEDLILGSLLLLVCLPFMLLIAAAVKLDSPGPVIFRQRRHGLDAKEITIYKFRTMKVLEDGPQLRQAQPDDPRITRVGVLLRRYSLDELPQLINVLQGHMSLVGPRPTPSRTPSCTGSSSAAT